MICLQNSTTLVGVNCCTSLSSTCTAIDANTDLAGIGVRVAFYIQSAVNALLVILSPRESMASAWASTILTAALVIGAIVSKIQQNLSLHHATLILNFATISCLSSLAVAPLLPVWRLRPDEYFIQEVRHAASMHDISDEEDGEELFLHIQSNRQKKRIKADQQRKRTILALAILTQVVLQWAWGFVLFVSWDGYSQPECNGDTVVLLFWAHFTAKEINNNFFWVWPLWLLFSLGITLLLTIVLAVTSPDLAQDIPSRSSISTQASGPSQHPIVRQLIHDLWVSIPTRTNRVGQFVLGINIVSLALWILFIFASEEQRRDNCLYSGENNFGGFGQITATLLALAPFWSLTIAVYRYPSLLRRRVKKFKMMQREEDEDEARSILSTTEEAHELYHRGESPESDICKQALPSTSCAVPDAIHQRHNMLYPLTTQIPNPDMGLHEWMEMNQLPRYIQ
ncbi:hypothetical protein OBBRIDRAFT_726092 [Obba rivulosa]|uniref:Uncharacterized protein n=1 Tax=Obba rivulosa TaxID=1052685 RepID=A0A8E2AXL3_9APHY|nr:hypothetical protein OBBRIDRAFT_726092 [Obba rivulosa]